MTSLQHRLTAVWFADVVGYSRLAGEDDAAALRLIQLFQSASRTAAERHDGKIVKFLGDGALAEFPSTESAVRAAHSLRVAFERESHSAVGEAHTLRIGVHVGDVASAPDGDLYGDGVNVAARLQAEAKPGQVLVSEDVWRSSERVASFASSRSGSERSRESRPRSMSILSRLPKIPSRPQPKAPR